MSISPADASNTTLPSTTAPTPPPVSPPTSGDLSMIMFWVFAVWAIASIVAATFLGAFRRRSIVGPIRVGSGEAALQLFIILLVGYLLGGLAGLHIARGIQLPDDLKQQVVQAAVLSSITLSIILALAVTLPGSLTRLGLKPGWITAGLIGGAATLFIVYPLIQVTSDVVSAIETLLHQPQPKAHELLLFMGKTHNPWWRALAVVSAVLLAPITEELMYRGLLQTVLGRCFAWIGRPMPSPVVPIPPESATLDYRSAPVKPADADPGAGARWTAVIITAGLFAAAHQSVPFFAPLFVLAIALGYIYERTGNLWINITTHALFNTGQIMIYIAMTR